MTPDPSGAARAPQTTDELVAEVKAALRNGSGIPIPYPEARWLGALVQAVEDQQREIADLLAALKVIGIEPPENPGEPWSLLLTEDGPEAGDDTAEATARMFMDDLTKREAR